MGTFRTLPLKSESPKSTPRHRDHWRNVFPKANTQLSCPSLVPALSPPSMLKVLYILDAERTSAHERREKGGTQASEGSVPTPRKT